MVGQSRLYPKPIFVEFSSAYCEPADHVIFLAAFRILERFSYNSIRHAKRVENTIGRDYLMN